MIRALVVVASLVVAGCPAIIEIDEPGLEESPLEEGATAEELVAELGSDDEEVRSRALERLVARRDAAVPALADALVADEAWIRARAAVALRRIGPAAAPAALALVAALDDRSANVRRNAVLALGDIGADPELVAPALARALSDPDLAVTSAASRALVRLGPAAVPDLVEGLESDDVVTRFGAVSALGELGPAATAAVPPLIATLDDVEKRVRTRTAWALGRTVPHTDPFEADAVGALIAMLDDPESSVRYATVKALAEIGPAAWPAREKLETMLAATERQQALADLPAPGGGPPPPADGAAPASVWMAQALRDALEKLEPTGGGS